MPHVPSTFPLFLAGALILLVIPGPAVFYILSRTIGQGRLAGVVSAAGISVGTLVHSVAAALGLSAILASSARAFHIVQFAGALYLIFLGVRMLLSRDEAALSSGNAPHSLPRVFGQGVLVNLLNPKTALFFLAFLPQFVDASRGHVSAQIFFLGCSFALLGLMSDSSWALLAGTLAERLRSSSRWRRAQKNISGGALIALGVATAFSGAKTK
ncbi:MAG TPA: LysE family translocator [Candidatus Acidoferrum sp.]|nr:LysE family translocator [Candidatus Acidoferrum sp.]